MFVAITYVAGILEELQTKKHIFLSPLVQVGASQTVTEAIQKQTRASEVNFCLTIQSQLTRLLLPLVICLIPIN